MEKVDILITGNLIANVILRGGGDNKCAITCNVSKETLEKNYDLTDATIINGNLNTNEFSYDSRIVVMGEVWCKSLGGLQDEQ